MYNIWMGRRHDKENLLRNDKILRVGTFEEESFTEDAPQLSGKITRTCLNDDCKESFTTSSKYLFLCDRCKASERFRFAHTLNGNTP